MTVQSRLSFFLFPAAALVTIISCSFFLIELVMIILDFSILTNVKGLSIMIFLTWLFVLVLIAMWTMLRNFIVHADKLEVNYLFGTIKFFYDYKTLKIYDYIWTTKGTLIQIPNGDQITLGELQYKNYSEIKEALEGRIQKEKIEIRYTTRFTRLMFVVGGVSLIFLLIVMNYFRE